MPRISKKKELLDAIYQSKQSNQLLDLLEPVIDSGSVMLDPSGQLKENEQLDLSDLDTSESSNSDTDSEPESNPEFELYSIPSHCNRYPSSLNDAVSLDEDMIEALKTQRYWISRSSHLSKAVTLESWFYQPALLNPRVFSSIFRMERSSFEKLVLEIESHSVFAVGLRGPRQTPVHYQLAVFLYKLGVAGNTYTQTGLSTGVGDGTVMLFVHRSYESDPVFEVALHQVAWTAGEELA